MMGNDGYNSDADLRSAPADLRSAPPHYLSTTYPQGYPQNFNSYAQTYPQTLLVCQ